MEFSQPAGSNKKRRVSTRRKNPYKREIALDCSSFRRIQSRAISLHSYYLTSLVNLSFYSFVPKIVFLCSDPDSFFFYTLSELPMFYRNATWISGCFFGGSFLIFGGSIVWFRTFFFRLLKIFTSSFFFCFAFSRFCFWMIYDLYSFFQRRWSLSLEDLPVHWYHPFWL